MISNVLVNVEYDECRKWIRNKRDRQIPWEELKYACKGNIEGLRSFIKTKQEDDDWPINFSVEMWAELIDELKKVELRRQQIQRVNKVAEIHDPLCENLEVTVPQEPASSWQLYKAHLIDDKHFSEDAVLNIEEASIEILRRLSRDTTKSGPVKGLVIGNVQSGKTANMAGLMAMAADWRWNLVIILSGTIENLRIQTQNRMIEDLKGAGNLTWVPIDHPSKKKPVAGQKTYELSLADNSNTRYLTVCLKAKSRLEDLIEWIEADRDQIQKMRVLVIDDEADQAGVSTGDVYTDEERKTINRLILNLVYCRDKDAINDETNKYKGNFKSMNYISYTATPYANCLNETGVNTLYPEHFIRTLDVAKSYFGPDQIFGKPDINDDNNLDIIRQVDKDQVSQIKSIQKNDSGEIPESLQNAIEWFICSVAALRLYGYKKPLSMLVHTSQKQDDHKAIANAIKRWIVSNQELLPDMCRKNYEDETKYFTKADLRKVFPDYEHPDDEIWNYPEFDKIYPYITEIIQTVSPIMMDEDGDLQYGKGIHLCIDNCAKRSPEDEGLHVRLAYPDEKTSVNLGYATAFIVVGGNTLARGLTLEGLVSTFFLRTIKQADTLMQMGRWFGYRTHYEMFPRIWMTEDTRHKFELLAEIDDDLREQIYDMQIAGKAPKDFNLTLRTSPKVSWLQLTAKNKMQMAEAAGVDFTGSDTQLTVYSKALNELRNNIDVTEKFLANLGKYRKSETGNEAYIWENINFAYIYENFFAAGFRIPDSSRAFQRMDLIAEWVNDQTKQGKMINWNVILCGNKVDTMENDKIWDLQNGIRIGKVNRSCKTESEDRVNIGILSGKKDYVADIRRKMLQNIEWDEMISNKNISTTYRMYREHAGVEKTPLFLIYRINKNYIPEHQKEGKKQRIPLSTEEDLIGITMVIPGTGIRGDNGVTRLKIKPAIDEDLEGELTDAN